MDGHPLEEPAFASTIVELSQELVCVLDHAGRVLEFNHAAEEATGYRAEEVIGRDARATFVQPEDVPTFNRILTRAFEQGFSAPVRGSWRTKDGGLRTLEFTSRPLLDEEGKVIYFVATGLDVTERERATEEARMLATEQSALRRVATLVARVPEPEEVFAAVAEEAGRLLGASQASTIRFEGEAGVTVGRWAAGEARGFEVGAVVPLSDPDALTATVARTGHPARIDDYGALRSQVAREMQQLGYRSAVAAPIIVEGKTWGAVMVASADLKPLGRDAEERLGDFAELVTVALESAQAHADLTASRARIVSAGDAERRRLERNLHDGAQQRLVGLALQLRLAQDSVRSDPNFVEGVLVSALAELQLAIEEVREIARGLHPAVLSERGLGPALESLAARVPFRVDVDGVPERRLPDQVEAGLYYVVSESLTNAAKHASPSHVAVAFGLENETAWVEIRDDGAGGALLDHGTGLQGLSDRVAALGGRFALESPAGAGTFIRAAVPLRKTVDSRIAPRPGVEQR